MTAEQLPLDPHQQLFVTNRKRFVAVYQQADLGGRELMLICGMTQVTFDEPDLFPFAERLVREESFMAGSATTWADPPLEWPRVQPLLEALLAEGLLAKEAPEGTIGQIPTSQLHLDFLEAEKQRAATEVPRFWHPDPGAVFQDLVGLRIEPGQIESVVPVHRIAHIALDREGRQVGEINSWPDQLRLKVETEWRTCNYAGSRYHDALPMNMTALRSMLAQWKPILRLVSVFHDEFVERYPQPPGRFRLGELHLLASGVLALVGYELMRWDGAVPNGDLDPLLSSLFRVTDGVRMVAAHMMDVPQLRCEYEMEVEPAEIGKMAERQDQYLSRKGVCAGPQNMIDELVATLVEGRPDARSEAPETPWEADIPVALDYGLRGVQLYAANFCVWMEIGRAYERIGEALSRAPTPTRGRLGKLRDVFTPDFQIAQGVHTTEERQRSWTRRFARKMFQTAQRGIRGLAEDAYVDLDQGLAPPPDLLAGRAQAALRDLFASAEEAEHAATHAAVLQEIADAVLVLLRFERNALVTIGAVQREINTLLGRPQPTSLLSGNHLAIHHRLRRNTVGGVPYVLDSIRDALGIQIDNRADSTTVSLGGRSLSLS